MRYEKLYSANLYYRMDNQWMEMKGVHTKARKYAYSVLCFAWSCVRRLPFMSFECPWGS